MSTLISLQQATLAFGTAPVLDKANFSLTDNERVCILGRNGAGKSSLLKVLAGVQQLDDGERSLPSHIRLAYVSQDLPEANEQSIYKYVASAFAAHADLLQSYDAMTHQMSLEPDNMELLTELARLQEQLDSQGAWQVHQAIEETLSRLGLQAETPLSALSGGWLRRVSIAKAWVTAPQVLLLDEPTNHLDIETISWLEATLKEFQGSIVFVSHDRAFIRAMATRIVDLDRGQLTDFPGDYDVYLVEKAKQLEVEAEHNAAFDKKLAEEEAWIRQGIKARRTRNEGRVRDLKKLREVRQERRNRVGQASFDVQTGEHSARIIWKAKEVGFRYGDKPIVNYLTITMQRGDKIAFVGPNGIGKSTLVKLILGELEPTSGTAQQGVNLEVAYYDQHRDALDLEQSVMDNVSDGKQEVSYRGRTRHIFSYLQDFLFSPQQARMPLKALSGGERNRVLLAKIFLKECNLLILDEPTNDLDIETLELLETVIADFPGTVLLVSHDREFIENTATSVLLFEGEGVVTEIIGGFHEVEVYQKHRQVELERRNKVIQQVEIDKDREKVKNTPSRSLGKSRNKLSYKDKRELESLPSTIENLEIELEALQEQVNLADFFIQSHEITGPVLERIEAIEEELMLALERWDELEQLQDNPCV